MSTMRARLIVREISKGARVGDGADSFAGVMTLMVPRFSTKPVVVLYSGLRTADLVLCFVMAAYYCIHSYMQLFSGNIMFEI